MNEPGGPASAAGLSGSRLLRTAQAWERMGITFSLPGAGLHIVEATKQLYMPGAVRAVRRGASRRLAPVLVPAPASRVSLRPEGRTAATLT